ncbi:hypothetical protein [Actinomyces bouchesdurhonensis]|uniref:hypothetical protein n=1 Tax=Actinomyces bouchesdurhonensis TaxID=1852361 RepID=UPI0023F07548|nr:hypothetical protein [Actinomyces bouchesdurhonensis]
MSLNVSWEVGVSRGAMSASVSRVNWPPCAVRQGPIQRWRSVASVRAELVPGPVSSMAEHVEAGRSLELWADLSEASKVRREAEAPERWLSRVTEVVEATSRATARGE